jgi:hypothetical protein
MRTERLGLCAWLDNTTVLRAKATTQPGRMANRTVKSVFIVNS